MPTQADLNYPEASPELDARLEDIAIGVLNEFGFNHAIRLCITILAHILRHAPDDARRREVFGHMIEAILQEVNNPTGGDTRAN